MEIRRATPEDYAGILELQSANYLENLTEREREQGFLSAQFTQSQIAAMAGDLGIMVARDRGRVAGYACSHRLDLAPQPPLIEAMVRCCATASYQAKPLAGRRLFAYGPVCIARAQRGRGLLQGLYCALLAELAGRFEAGVTLVAENNPHSLHAHVDGLGMVKVGQFEHGGRGYHLLAFAA